MGKETYEYFETWRRLNNIEFATTPLKLGVALSNLQIKGGITKGQHTRNGDTKYFHIPKLKDYIKIGLLIDFEESVVAKVNIDTEKKESKNDDDEELEEKYFNGKNIIYQIN